MALIDNETLEITKEQIAAEGLSALDDKYQKSVGFFAWDYFVALGKIVYDLWQKVIYFAKCLTDLSNMEYDDLVNFVFQTRGITAKTATYANGVLKVIGGEGTIIQGSIFETSTGIQFSATETKTVAQNDVFNVQCLTEGVIGNVAVNTVTVIPTTIQGIVSVTNESAFSNGYEKETKEDLLKRYYEDIQTPITSGNKYHYKKWALEVTGVGNAKVKPLWNGDNTVKVVIINSNNEIPSNDLVSAVQEYIDPNSLGLGEGQAPIGAYCTVTGASAKNISIAVTGLQLKTGAVLATVKENIENDIKKYFSDISFEDNYTYVSYAEIGAIIKRSDGVFDYTSYTVNASTDNVTLADTDLTTEIPILSAITYED